MKNDTSREVQTIDSKEYLAELMDRYSNLVFSICYKITNHYFDAQDLTQETFLSVYKNLPTFDGNNEKAWVSQIATNKCLDFIKNASRRTLPTEAEYFQGIESHASSPEELTESTLIKERLSEICKNLKPPYDEIAQKYFCEEMTVKEISKTTGKNIKTIQTQVYRARDMLKSLWRKEHNYGK